MPRPSDPDDEANEQQELLPIVHRSMDYRRVESDRRLRTEGAIMVERSDTPTLEESFAYEWEAENVPQPGVNQGHGVLQNLMFDPTSGRGWRSDGVCREVITQRDARIVATIVQWLGTNVGSGFLHRVFEKAGYQLLHPSERDRYRRVTDDLRTAEQERNRFSRLAMERQRNNERLSEEAGLLRSRIDTAEQLVGDMMRERDQAHADLSHATDEILRLRERIAELERELVYEDPNEPLFLLAGDDATFWIELRRMLDRDEAMILRGEDVHWWTALQQGEDAFAERREVSMMVSPRGTHVTVGDPMLARTQAAQVSPEEFVRRMGAREPERRMTERGTAFFAFLNGTLARQNLPLIPREEFVRRYPELLDGPVNVPHRAAEVVDEIVQRVRDGREQAERREGNTRLVARDGRLFIGEREVGTVPNAEYEDVVDNQGNVFRRRPRQG